MLFKKIVTCGISGFLKMKLKKYIFTDFSLVTRVLCSHRHSPDSGLDHKNTIINQNLFRPRIKLMMMTMIVFNSLINLYNLWYFSDCTNFFVRLVAL